MNFESLILILLYLFLCRGFISFIFLLAAVYLGLVSLSTSWAGWTWLHSCSINGSLELLFYLPLSDLVYEHILLQQCLHYCAQEICTCNIWPGYSQIVWATTMHCGSSSPSSCRCVGQTSLDFLNSFLFHKGYRRISNFYDHKSFILFSGLLKLSICG